MGGGGGRWGGGRGRKEEERGKDEMKTMVRREGREKEEEIQEGKGRGKKGESYSTYHKAAYSGHRLTATGDQSFIEMVG